MSLRNDRICEACYIYTGEQLKSLLQHGLCVTSVCCSLLFGVAATIIVAAVVSCQE